MNVSSGSRFQTNALEGVDQGMSSITLRGLDASATLLLINSKRHTFSGTPSNNGNSYIDANIIPEIAIEKIEILKEGATSIYGSDAIAGVINFFTFQEFEGLKVKTGKQITTNYNQDDDSFGILFGTKILDGNLVIGFNSLVRSPLCASEIDGIADLSISTFGKTFITTEKEEILSGPYQGTYEKGEKIPDPNCESNGGILLGGFCKFAYGKRFNVINKRERYRTNFWDTLYCRGYFQ